jgi:hypothetical protein
VEARLSAQSPVHAAETSLAVVRWRREQLAHAGFPLPLAARIAKDPGYDLHRLIEIVESGCPTELAIRILAPLEAGEAA